MFKKNMDLIRKIPSVEIDLDTLRTILHDYRKPEGKIDAWIRDGVLIRVKSGWFVLGENLRTRPLSVEYLANVIYAPSYISLDYALSFHGLIPERVETITSVTTENSRTFDTPVGRFSYRHISRKSYRAGMDLHIPSLGPAFLIATPERALADKIQHELRGHRFQKENLFSYLTENLRIDYEDLEKMDVRELQQIARAYGSRKIVALSDLISQMKGNGA